MSNDYQMPEWLRSKILGSPEIREHLTKSDINTSRWVAGLASLDSFVAREGHARVSLRHVEVDFNLGQWVSDRRKGRAEMSIERTAALESRTGWTWAPSEQSFIDGLAALDAFVAREGHARVPRPHVEEGFKLGDWSSTQRKGRAEMSIERTAALESRTGWTWDPLEQIYIDGLAALDAFVAREGHARVPTEHVEAGLNLGTWVSRQRSKRAALSAERIAALDSRAGWTWDILAQIFIDGLAALDAFVAREGHARVHRNHIEAGFNLGTWISRQRSRRATMPPERIATLESRAGWTWDPLEQDFLGGLSALDAFIAREGHARVPGRHVEAGFNLGAWASRQRSKRAALSAERIAALDSRAGWTWDPLEQIYIDGLAALDAFVAREGHARVHGNHVEAGFNLGTWISRQRSRRATMPPERIATLESRAGWTWDPLEQDFLGGLSALDAFIAREGHARVPAMHIEAGLRLGSWVGSRRRMRATMPPERIATLESRAGWLWDARATS